MKAIILYTNTGGGHSSAAKAISEALKDLNVVAKPIDSLKVAGERVTDMVAKMYNGTVRKNPAFFGLLVNVGDKVSHPDRKSIIYWLNTLYASNMYELIKEENPDIIVCTHLFGGQTISHIKKKYKLSALTAAIITDYTYTPLWEETSLDYYFVPHKDLIEQFTERHMPKEKIFPLGIPVSKAFKLHVDKGIAKKKLNYDPEKFHALVMGGSMGAGKVFDAAKYLAENMPDAEVTVICGSNKKLYGKMKALNLNANVRIIEYENNIAELMSSADVLITKPGGLTSTEAMVKQLPFIIITPLPGGEEANRDFFIRKDLAVYSKSPSETLELCKYLMKREVREKIINSQKSNINRDAGADIANFLINRVKDRR